MGIKKRIVLDSRTIKSSFDDPLRILMGNVWNKNLTSWGAAQTMMTPPGTKDYKYLPDLKYNNKKVEPNRTLGMKYITLSSDEGSKNWKMKDFKPADLMTPEDTNWAIEELTLNFQKLGAANWGATVMKHIELLLEQERDSLFNNWDTSFFDYSFDLTVPIPEEIIKKINMPIQPKCAKVTPTYNFYEKDYEAADPDDPDLAFVATNLENLLYNLYVLSLLEKLEDTTSQKLKNYKDGLKHALYKALKSKWSFKLAKTLAGYSSGGKPTLPYWKNYWESTKKLFDGVPKQMANLFFSSTDTDLLKEFNEKKFLFPVGIELEFSSQEVEAITDTLAKAKSMFPLMYKAATHSKLSAGWFKQYKTNTPYYVKVNDKFELKNDDTAEETQLITVPIKEFIEDYATKGAAALNPALKDYVTYITSGEEKIPTEGGTSFIEKLKAKILESKLEQILVDKGATSKTTIEQKYSSTNLSILDIFNGALSPHNEVVFFQIDKYKVLNGAEEQDPIQTIMIPNTEDVDTHKYFDSQVLYNTEYTYKVYVWCLVVGTEYKYVGPDEFKVDWQKPDAKYIFNDANLKVKVAYRPTVSMIRVPYFEYGSKDDPIYVLDNPPTEPNVNIVPYKNEDSRVLITVDSGIGSYMAAPVILNDADKGLFEDVKKYQKHFLHDISDNKVLFESDDPVVKFEVFRTTERPERYEDFAASSLTTIKAADGGFVDQIAPNTKYYYTARSIDVHGLVSNPSAIYEVELINNSGAIYPKIRIVNLEQIEPAQKRVKSIKRFLKIEPIVEQVMINPLKIPDSDDSAKKLNKGNLIKYIGVLDESIFSEDKKFKIRITSKHTKKKMDINLRFRASLTNNT